jgi:O-antigen ligase
VAAADVLLLAAAAARGVACLRERSPDGLRLPPWPHLFFVGWVLLAAILADRRGAAAREWVQAFAYFAVAPVLAADTLRRHGTRALAAGAAAFLAAGAVVLVTAAAQYVDPDPHPLSVRGSFGNRNVLGGYLVLLLPVVCGVLLRSRRWPVRLGLAAMLLAGLAVCLSGGAMLALCLALAGLAAVRYGPAGFGAACVLLVAWIALALPCLPRGNDAVLVESVAVYDANGAATRRYPEWQAAGLMALEHPWFGVGPGSYQANVGRFYGVWQRPTGPSEPDIQNLHLVLAASCGLPAAAAFAAMLLLAAAAARRSAAAVAGDWPRGLFEGSCAALVAFGIAAVWSPLLVRGIGLPLAFVLAAAWSGATPDSAPSAGPPAAAGA